MPFCPPGDLPNPGIKPKSPALIGGFLPLCHLGIPVLVSAVQKNESVIYIPISTLFLDSLRISVTTEQSVEFLVFFNRFSLSILYIVMYICQSQSFSSSHPTRLSPLGVHMLILYACISFCFFANRFICAIFLDFTYMHVNYLEAEFFCR